MNCLECGLETGKSKRGHAKRFCAMPCKVAFNSRRSRRGAEIYDLFRAHRRDRSEAAKLEVWTEMCRLDTLWEDEDRAANRATKSYKPSAMALSDLHERNRVPTTNIYVKEKRA
jgi:hypothetical protein